MQQPPRRIGIKDVAQKAGVALSSVSRVLDGHPDVSDSMRKRVMDAVHSLGYTPDPVAQSMRRGTTMTVGFVAGDTSNPLIAQIALAAQLSLREDGYSLLLANSGNDAVLEQANIRLLMNRKVDGLLLSVFDETAPGLSNLLSESRVPVVLVDREVAGAPVSSVQSEHAMGITRAAEHLLALGHRRVALVNGNPRVRPSRARAEALKAAFAGVAGIETSIASGTFSDAHGYDATMALLQRRLRPTALIAGSNQILVGVLRAIRDLRLSIPDDLSIVTCDATPVAELHVPEIATIRRDAREIGKSAAELLIDLMNGGDPTTLILPTEFVPGASCAAPMKASN